MRLSEFVGQDAAKLGLLLTAIDPRCGGLLLLGGHGTGKSTLARLARGLWPPDTPFLALPLNATDEALLGGCDLEATLRRSRRVEQPGLFARARGGVLVVDDINLLGPQSLALLLAAHEQAAERSAGDERAPRTPPFTLIATMNPEAGDLSGHAADRFGLCAVMPALTAPGPRQQVLRNAAARRDIAAEPDPSLRARIAAARVLLPTVRVPEASLEHVVGLAAQNGCRGHRGDLSLWYAGRAYAAWRGDAEVTPAHLDQVGELVFAHRRPAQVDPPSEGSGDRREDAPSREGHAEPPERDAPPRGRDRSQPALTDGVAQGEHAAQTVPRAGAREEVMETGAAFPVRRFVFRKDRLVRRADGRRTRTEVAGREGWPVGTRLESRERDVALGATIRACAPFQPARGRVDRLRIAPADLRFHRREGRMGHLVVFVVDGSGSMGAQRRMVAAKGAVQALLLDCYHRRDRVAMIVFRKDRAELVLPPTTSVELAATRLAGLPVGGKTPLAAGLLAADQLVQRELRQRPKTRMLLVLVTDGRGNHALRGDLHGEIAALARLLAGRPQCDCLVIDTEPKRNALRTDMASTLARQLGAVYCPLELLPAEGLVTLVRAWSGDFGSLPTEDAHESREGRLLRR